MTISEIFTKCLKSRGFTYRSLAAQMEVTASTISDRVHRGNMQIDKLIELMDVLGYDVVIKDRRTAATPMKLNGVSEEE